MKYKIFTYISVVQKHYSLPINLTAKPFSCRSDKNQIKLNIRAENFNKCKTNASRMENTKKKHTKNIVLN